MTGSNDCGRRQALADAARADRLYDLNRDFTALLSPGARDAMVLDVVAESYPLTVRDWRRVARIHAQEPWRDYQAVVDAAPNLLQLVLTRGGLPPAVAKLVTEACARAIAAELGGVR